MEEKIFYENGDVSVSNSRFIVDGQTYAMSNVTSVKTKLEKAKRIPGILITLFGVGVVGVNSMVGGVMIVVGIVVLILAKNKYSVALNTSSGENQALTSTDKNYIEEIVSALNDAIVSRG